MKTLAQLPSTAAAMATLTLSHPLLAAAIAHLPATETDTTDVIGIDGKSVGVNPDFFAARDEKGRVYMLAFIAGMVSALYLDRVGDRDPKVWGLACNIATHQMLAELGVEGRPEDIQCIHEDGAAGLTADEIYDRLLDGSMTISGHRISELLRDRDGMDIEERVEAFFGGPANQE